MIFLGLIFLVMLSMLLLESIVALYLPVFGATAKFMLISLVFFSLRYGSIFGEVYGFFSGMLVDIFVTDIFGLYSLIYTIIGYFIGSMSQKIDETKTISQVIVVCMAIFMYFLLAVVIKWLVKVNYKLTPEIVIATGIFNLIVAPVMFFLLDKVVLKIEKWSKRK